MTPQETPFARGYRKAYEASQQSGDHVIYPATYVPPAPPPVDYTMPILVGCLTGLLIALVLAMALRRKA